MTHQLNRIGFIGAGRLAQVMALALARAVNKVVAVCSRRTTSARALADRLGSEGHTVTVMPDSASLVHACDTVFITVSDDQIHPVADGLPWRADQVALHCSGATDLAALAAAAQAGAHPAGFHPLHTFGDLETALAGLAGVVAAPFLSLSPSMSADVIIDSFVVVVIGGLGSLAGAFIAALVLGMVQAIGAVYLPDAAVLLPFVFMIGILIWKPSGFAGSRT